MVVETKGQVAYQTRVKVPATMWASVVNGPGHQCSRVSIVAILHSQAPAMAVKLPTAAVNLE